MTCTDDVHIKIYKVFLENVNVKLTLNLENKENDLYLEGDCVSHTLINVELIT